MKKKSAERNKIWPAASQQQSLMKWPDLKHVLTRPPPTTSAAAAAWHHHRRLDHEAEEDQEAQVKYYPPPTTPRHHRYTMISRSSSASDSGSHNDQMMMMSSREYWDARRVFLSSYSFTDKKKKADGGPVIVLLAADVEYWLKGKGKMWVEEVKAAAAGLARYVVREVKRRRVVVKGCRLTFALPSFVVVRMRCVTPWITTQPPPGVVSV